jgi:hypothetical protein
MDGKATESRITLQISAPVYWGFKVTVPKSDVYRGNEVELINYIKKQMKLEFKKLNLLELVEGIDSLDLHMHLSQDVSQDTVVYVCDCEHI